MPSPSFSQEAWNHMEPQTVLYKDHCSSKGILYGLVRKHRCHHGKLGLGGMLRVMLRELKKQMLTLLGSVYRPP